MYLLLHLLLGILRQSYWGGMYTVLLFAVTVLSTMFLWNAQTLDVLKKQWGIG